MHPGAQYGLDSLMGFRNDGETSIYQTKEEYQIFPGILRFHQVPLLDEAEDSDNSLPDISPDDLQPVNGM